MTATPKTLEAAVAAATARLAAAGVEAPRRDARLLICRLLGSGPELFLGNPQRALAPAERERIDAAIARRAAREPVSRILGVREFWSLPFQLNDATLDPRADSETLVEAVLAAIRDHENPLRLLDLGTGSGCLLLALLSELRKVTGLGIDISVQALAMATENSQRLGLASRAAFRRHSWNEGLEALGGPWDVIVSNPPYIASSDITDLAPEVAGYEPAAALDGGCDGLDAYRALVPAAAAVLVHGGVLALEIGEGQAAPVDALLRSSGLRPLRRARDLAGTERCLLALKSTNKPESGTKENRG